MTTSYLALKAQIEELTAKAESVRVAELASVIAEIKQKIEEFGISAADLGFTSEKTSRKFAKATEASEKRSVQPKYKGPNGELWSGRGISPKWTKALPAGKSIEDYKI